jgi:leucyl aminopeptidase
MTPVEVAGGDPLDRPADTLVVGVFTGGIEGPGVAAVIRGLGLPSLPLTPSFRGDIGQHLLLASPGLPCATVLFVGLGRMVATDASRLREAARVAASTGALSGHVVTTLALVHPSAAAIGAVAEGFLVGAARRTRFGRDDPGQPAVGRITILAPTAMRADGERTVRRANATAAAAIAARDLVDVPPNMQSPVVLAHQIADLTAGVCGADLHERSALEPTDPLGHVVLCGRGTTFASGGLGLRRDDTMTTAKADMAGAAVIAAACAGLAALDVRVRVTALLGLVERMPGGDAQRPGDVVTTRGGTTIEVTDANADAVLVLADLVDLARAYEPDAIVDVATVGGGTAAALGRDAGAVMGTDDRLVDDLLAAADTAGEPLWRLPLWDHMDRVLTSPVADVVNDGRTTGGAAIVAGLILRRVARDVPWAHIDYGDAAFIPDLPGDQRGRRPGATGYGARTLLGWLEHRTT